MAVVGLTHMKEAPIQDIFLDTEDPYGSQRAYYLMMEWAMNVDPDPSDYGLTGARADWSTVWGGQDDYKVGW